MDADYRDRLYRHSRTGQEALKSRGISRKGAVMYGMGGSSFGGTSFGSGSSSSSGQAGGPGGQDVSALANKFWDAWQSSLGNVMGMYNKAAGTLGKSQNYLNDLKKYAGSIDALGKQYGDKFAGLYDQVMSDYGTYSAEFDPLQNESLAAARERLQQRGELATQLMSLARPDYRGVSDRALADVNAQAEKERREAARREAGLGIDPTSGRSRARTTQSHNDEVLAKALAANTARRGEKDRVTGITQAGLQLLNPAVEANMADQIQGRKTQQLGLASGVMGAGAGVETGMKQLGAGFRQNLLTQQRGIAGDYATLGEGIKRATVDPYSDIYSSLAGYQIGQNQPVSKLNPVAGGQKVRTGITPGYA